MLDRCYNPNFKQYQDYGGRGIKVCPQWRYDYKQFIKDMSPRPSGTSIDRINNNKDYSPENCKWSTKKEQQRNQRRTIYVTVEGKRYKAIELSEIAEQKVDTIVDRAKRGLTYNEVISKERFFNFNEEKLKLGAQISAAKRNAKTHCKKGHKYTEENTYIQKSGKYSWRCCRRCHADRQLARNNK